MKLVMTEVFGVGDDPERIINEVKKIVNKEIESNEISRVEGTRIVEQRADRILEQVLYGCNRFTATT